MSLEFTEKELAAMRSEYGKGATDSQWELFISECKTRNLRPGVHLVFQLRKSKEFDSDTGSYIWVNKPYWITTIGALRLIIERTGKYAGQTEPEYIYLDDEGNPTLVSKIPLPQKGSQQIPREPWAVRVGIKRKDFDEPIYGLARFEAVAGMTKTDKGYVLTSIWAKRAPEMTAKCAEADGIRKAAPEEAGSFYIAEELKDEIEHEKVTPASVTVSAPVPPPPPPVNQTPAQPTETPRPNEIIKEIKKAEPSPNFADAPPSDSVSIPQPTDPQPVSQIEKPESKKRGRRPKPENPENGQVAGVDTGITDEDLNNLGTPLPEITDEDRREAQAFVESVSNFTPEEAAAQGLPTPPDESRIPEKGGEELKGFISRFRALQKEGVSNEQLAQYFTKKTGKKESSELTVKNWSDILSELEAAKQAGNLKEVVRG